MTEHTRQNRFRDKCIRENMEVAPIVEKMVQPLVV